MPGIVCAVRGGTDSQATIAEAIDLAQGTGLQLYFLYVVNLDFLVRTSVGRTHTISEQMQQMGEFILLAAQDAASQRGVVAEGVVRHGEVGEEIVDLCHELSADYLVVGRPRLEREQSVFDHAQLDRFVERAEQQTGARVVVAEGVEE